MAEQYVARTLPVPNLGLPISPNVEGTVERDFMDAGLTLAVTGHLNVEQFLATSIGSSIGSWVGNTIVDQYKNSVASTTPHAQQATTTQTTQQQQQAASQNSKLQSTQSQPSSAAQDDSDNEDDQDDNDTDQNTSQSQSTSRTQVDKQQTDTSGLSGAGMGGPDFQKSNNDWLLKNYSGMFGDPMQNALSHQLAQNYADDAAQAAEDDAYNQSFTQKEVAQYGGPGMLSDATQEAANAALATVKAQSSQPGNSFWGKAGDEALTGFIKGASNPEDSAFGDLGHPIDSYNNFSQADGYGDLELGAEIVGGGLMRAADAVMFFSGAAGATGLRGLGQLEAFSDPTSTLDILSDSDLLRQRVEFNIAQSQAASATSNFEIHTLIEKIPYLDVTTGMDEAVFWSGKGNQQLATLYSLSENKLTIEMTPGGSYLDSLSLFDRYPYEQAVIPWGRLSASFAENAMGEVSTFVENARPAGIFNTIELPILRNNPNVTNIIFSPEVSYSRALTY